VEFELYDHQKRALQFLDNGKVLYGGVGDGKSLTAIAYYAAKESPKDIYVITTAKKRDSLEWVREAARYGIGSSPDATIHGVLTVDSWNNIWDYVGIKDAFFIFDEQRLVGTGAWVKAFQKIAKVNRWILLSATPGDNWLDYAPIFIANGFFKNITEFKRRHVIYAPYVSFPKVVGYQEEGRLLAMRNAVLVEMPYAKKTERIINYVPVGYDKELFRFIVKERWHPYESRPLRDAGDTWRLLRKVTYSDPSRLETVRELLKTHRKMIIFYYFDYELDILQELTDDTTVAEWNGHRKHPIPDTDSWVYLVQYTSGAEGWNCTETDAMVMYSLTYSYKRFVQAQGRIDRIDTKFTKLYYYVLDSNNVIDNAVKGALQKKKSFNERHIEKLLKSEESA
jgi:hypothetical protein